MPYFTLVEDFVWDGQENGHVVEKIIKTEKPLKAILSGKVGKDVGRCEGMYYPWHLVPSAIPLEKDYPVRIIRELSPEEVEKLFKDAEKGLETSHKANLATVWKFFSK